MSGNNYPPGARGLELATADAAAQAPMQMNYAAQMYAQRPQAAQMQENMAAHKAAERLNLRASALEAAIRSKLPNDKPEDILCAARLFCAFMAGES